MHEYLLTDIDGSTVDEQSVKYILIDIQPYF